MKKHYIITSIILILLSLIGFRLFKMFSSNTTTLIKSDSLTVQYDTLFHSIDSGLTRLLIKNDTVTFNPLKYLGEWKMVNNGVTKRIVDPNQESFAIKKNNTFYLVTKPGFIANSRGAVQYYLTGENGKYCYRVTLKNGLYQYQTVDEPRDTVTFVVESGVVSKLGYQHLHSYFVVLEDSI